MTTRIGILGGAFNPPHFGHLRPALEAMTALDLEAVFFLPTGNHPFKDQTVLAPVKHRVAMTRLAIQDQSGFELCDLESSRSRVSYTIDTLTTLHNRFPLSELIFLPGGDLLSEIHLWKEWQRLIQLAHICFLARPGFRPPAAESDTARFFQPFQVKDPGQLYHHRLRKNGFCILTVTPLAICSTDLRQLLRQRKSIRYLTPEPVIDYIHQNCLYANGNE